MATHWNWTILCLISSDGSRCSVFYVQTIRCLSKNNCIFLNLNSLICFFILGYWLHNENWYWLESVSAGQAFKKNRQWESAKRNAISGSLMCFVSYRLQKLVHSAHPGLVNISRCNSVLLHYLINKLWLSAESELHTLGALFQPLAVVLRTYSTHSKCFITKRLSTGKKKSECNCFFFLKWAGGSIYSDVQLHFSVTLKHYHTFVNVLVDIHPPFLYMLRTNSAACHSTCCSVSLCIVFVCHLIR